VTRAPALHLSRLLYLRGVAAAAALSVIAVLFALAASGRGRDATAIRLAALGMVGRQAFWLRLTDAVPLLAVTAAGVLAATWLLVEVVGPVLGLTALTGSAASVPLQLSWQASRRC
jgi:hypothetical protein